MSLTLAAVGLAGFSQFPELEENRVKTAERIDIYSILD